MIVSTAQAERIRRLTFRPYQLVLSRLRVTQRLRRFRIMAKTLRRQIEENRKLRNEVIARDAEIILLKAVILENEKERTYG